MIWIAKRIAVALILVWIVATIVFLAIQMVPGDPAEMLLSQGGVAPDPAIVEELRTQLGLDRPILEQYLDSMWGLLRGDLGVSLIDGNPVGELIAQRLPRTLELIGAAALLALLIGLPAGLIAAMRRGGTFDRVASFVAAWRWPCQSLSWGRYWCSSSRRSCASSRLAATFRSRNRPDSICCCSRCRP